MDLVIALFPVYGLFTTIFSPDEAVTVFVVLGPIALAPIPPSLELLYPLSDRFSPPKKLFKAGQSGLPNPEIAFHLLSLGVNDFLETTPSVLLPLTSTPEVLPSIVVSVDPS